MDSDVPDYPNYATALSVSALSRLKPPGWEADVRRMIDYLRKQQFVEQNGWRQENPVYGAWGMGGIRRTPPDTGHVDLSMTRYVLEALSDGGVPLSDPVFAHAAIFVERCQNLDPQNQNNFDGGFFFSTTEADTNKAGSDGSRFRSYGTTTADGILALLAIGKRLDDSRVLAAERWLTSHHHDMEVPGFVGEAYQRWPRGLAFYYSAVSAQAFRAAKSNPGKAVIEALYKVQRRDGSWSNPEKLVKEDDPLIATTFAVEAITSGL
jgi:squalene-hopene/tetraprenyl-beta-curcumene cyclase